MIRNFWDYFCALLFTFAALRDLFAPGFFAFTNHRAGKEQIAIEFLLGAAFLARGLLTRRSQTGRR